MVTGRPPKPLELKRAQGNPGRRPLPAPDATIPVERIPPKAPRSIGLGREGRRTWETLATLRWVAATDATALVNACRTADLIALLEADVAEKGVTYESRGRLLQNPSVGRVVEARKLLHSMLASFGVTPADRTRLGIAEVKAQSKFEEMLDRRNRRQDG